ncbi:MAG: ABC transporter permease, partial [Terriglobales bacterium]
MLRPLPLPNAGRIVSITGAGLSATHGGLAWWQQSRAVDPMALYQAGNLDLATTSAREYVAACAVSPDFFRVAQVAPEQGRWLDEEDFQGSPAAAVISDGLRRREFGGVADVVGAKLAANGAVLTVVGVMPAGFGFPASTELWLPGRGVRYRLGLGGTTDARLSNGMDSVMIGRLGGEASLPQARAELNVLLARLLVSEHFPASGRPDAVQLRPLPARMGARSRPALTALLVAAGLLFALCCANVCGVIVARGLLRRTEFAVRCCLGADRLDLLVQACAEASVTAGFGTLLGLAASALLLAWIGAIAPPSYWGLNALRLGYLGTLVAGGAALASIAATSLAVWRTIPIRNPLQALGNHGGSTLAPGWGVRALAAGQFALVFR